MAPTKKASAVKKAPARSAVAGRDVPAKSTAASKAPAKKAPATTKAPAKKAPAAASAARKAPAKKAPAAAPAKAPAKPTAKPPAKAPVRVVSPPALARKAVVKKAPPKRTGPLDKFLLGQLQALEDERVTYVRQAASLKAEADLLAAEREPGDVQFDEESGEGDTLAVERERDLTLSYQASQAVEEIDLSVAKLKDGTYGVCEQCNGIIPKERLRALPHAALCVQCKSAGFSRR